MSHLYLHSLFLTIIFFWVCEVKSQECGTPPIPVNSKVKELKNTEEGLQATYECDSGYELFGSPSIKCNNKNGWDASLPICGVNIAIGKPTNQSSNSRLGPSYLANDGIYGNKSPDEQECSETKKEPSPWWQIDLLVPQSINVVRITTRSCCGYQLQDLEIRAGNSSDLQKNPLCAWFPGTLEEGVTKTFSCARVLIGQFVFIQLVGVESSLSLCEVEIFSKNEISSKRCIRPKFSADTHVTTFLQTCYEFYTKSGDRFDKAQENCKINGGNLINSFGGARTRYILSELDRRKSDLKTNLVWIGAQKEPGISSRTWKWINGNIISKPSWGKDQPNNYNGEQNCVVFDGGRNWLWNDVGCNLDYLHYICQYEPFSCGSPDIKQNSSILGSNFTIKNTIKYSCIEDHAIIGEATRVCTIKGSWNGTAPSCKYVECGTLSIPEHGNITLSKQKTTYGTTANYFCHKNFTLVGSKQRTCEIDGWTGEQPSCMVDWCSNPPSIFGGKVEIEGNQIGSSATYKCDNGYVMTGERIITCELGGKWSSKSPTCRFVDCGAPARPDRGNLILINDTTTVGSIVNFACDEDYWLVGSRELICTIDGKWSGNTPFCELITCDTPQVPPGSYVVGYDYNVHSTIHYNCDPGHVLRGNSRLECLSSGVWSDESPICEYIDCRPITQFSNGHIEYMQNTTYIGSKVNFKCLNSYKLSGTPQSTCLESGVWSNASPRCDEIRCTEPVLASHSILSITGNDRMYGRTLIRTSDSAGSVHTYKIGALAKYRCERGYKIIGDPLVTCSENGQWSGVIPECLYVDCGQLSTIENGKVSLATNATYYGAAVLYECVENYKMNGVSRRICNQDGTWSHEEPKCEEITCGKPDLNSDMILVDDKPGTVGSVSKVQCLKGRFLIGNNTRTCLKNGIWSGKPPTCKPVDCGNPLQIENGRVIIVNESTTYGGSAEYHCIPNFFRIGPYLRKCLDNGQWSGEEPRCEISVAENEESHLGSGIAIGATIIIVLLVAIALLFLYRNKARPVKNTENVQAAELKEDRNAAVMSYSTFEISNPTEPENSVNTSTFNTFHPHPNNDNIRTENVYDQIPNEQWQYDSPYEMKTNEEVYEPEPHKTPNSITINGIAVR